MQKFAHVEKALNWGPAARQCGPAFVANASRNFVMSATSFVITPTLYRDYVPQEHTLTLTLALTLALALALALAHALPRLRSAGAQVAEQPTLVRPGGQHLLR